MILSHDDNIASQLKRVQQTVFRQAVARGVTLKVISIDSGLGYTTIQSYARGEAAMSLPSLYRLVGVIDDDLLSLLLPAGRLIVSVPDDVDHDVMAGLASDYLRTKADAHNADSPAGREIAPCEGAELNQAAAKLRSVGP